MAGKLIPLTRVRPVWDRGDAHLVGRVIVTRKPEFAVVIAGNPECVVAAHRCRDIPAQTRAVVISPVGRGFETRQRVSEVRRGTHRDVRHAVAVDPGPYLTADGSRSRGHSGPLQGEVVGILVCVVVADAQGRAPRAHCTRIEANLETGSPARRHCTRRLRDDAEVGGIRSRQRGQIERQRARTEVLDGEGARDRSRGKIGAPKVGVVRATWACIAVNDRRPIAQDIDLRPLLTPVPCKAKS